MTPRTTAIATITRTFLGRRLMVATSGLAFAAALAVGIDAWRPLAVDRPATPAATPSGGSVTAPSGRIDTPPEPEPIIYLVATAAEADALAWGLVRNPAAEQPALRALILAAGTANEATWTDRRAAELGAQRLSEGLPPARIIDLRHQGDRASRSRPDGA